MQRCATARPVKDCGVAAVYMKKVEKYRCRRQKLSDQRRDSGADADYSGRRFAGAASTTQVMQMQRPQGKSDGKKAEARMMIRKQPSPMPKRGRSPKGCESWMTREQVEWSGGGGRMMLYQMPR